MYNKFILTRKKRTGKKYSVVLLIYQVSDKRLLPGCGIKQGFLSEAGKDSPGLPAHRKSRSPEQKITSSISGVPLKGARRSLIGWSQLPESMLVFGQVCVKGSKGHFVREGYPSG